MRRFSLSILTVLGVAAGAGVSSASAQDKLSVRLDFLPWGVSGGDASGAKTRAGSSRPVSTPFECLCRCCCSDWS